MLSLFIGKTSNKICCFQKNQTGRKTWSQRISVIWQVLPLVGYCTAVKIQTNLNMSVCQWAGRAPLAWGKWGFGLTLRGKGFAFFCLHWLLTCRETGVLLPFANFSLGLVEFLWQRPPLLTHLPCTMMGTTRQFWVPHLTGCTEHPEMRMDTWVQACVCPARAAPGKVPLDIHFQGSLSHAAWHRVSPHAQGTNLAANATPVSCVGFLIIGCQVKKKRERLHDSVHKMKDWFMRLTLKRYQRAWCCIWWLQEKLWSIVTLHRQQELQTQHAPLWEPGFISSTPHKAAYYILCLAGFIVTCSTSDAECWPGSHESTTSISTSSTVTRWTDFHPSDLNEPPGNRDLNHRCLLFTLAGEAALMMYGPTAAAEI